MALLPFAGALVGRVGIWALAGALVRMAASRTFQIGAGGLVISDFLNLDWLNQEALKIAAPGSDPASVRETANMAGRMLGLDGSEVLWPRRRDGTPVFPKYFTVDLTTGRAWLHDQYYSRKTVNAARRMGAQRARGFGRPWFPARRFNQQGGR